MNTLKAPKDNLPQEAPQAFADAVIEVDSYGSVVNACLREQHKAPARRRRLRQTVSLNGISVCCLRMRFDEPEQLVNATRNLREQIRRVRITRFACGLNCASRARATICQRAG